TESVEEDHLLPLIELAPSGSCGLLRSLESFAEPPGILGSPAWRSLDVGWLDDPVPECYSSTAQVGVDSGCAASLPSYCRGSPRCKSVPGLPRIPGGSA